MIFLRKIFAIVLLSVLLFNLFGYRLYFMYMELNANAEMCAALDSNAYQRQDLIEIKVPLHLPYIINSSSFERYDGTENVNGISYNYVDRKVENDTLFMHCIRNNAESNLNAAQNNYANINVNQSANESKANQASLLFSILMIGCISQNISSQISSSNIASAFIFPTNDDAILNVFIASPAQPPEVNC